MTMIRANTTSVRQACNVLTKPQICNCIPEFSQIRAHSVIFLKAPNVGNPAHLFTQSDMITHFAPVNGRCTMDGIIG